MENFDNTLSNSSLNRGERNGNFKNNRSVYSNPPPERTWDRLRVDSQENLRDLKTDVASQIETTKRVLQLVNDSGLEMTQVNGQRKLGPPPNWTGSPPDPRCEVFVGKLPRDLYESEIYPIFRKIGEIYEIRLMMDFSGTNRGYCFVMYTNTNDAYRAIQDLDNYEIRSGKRIGVLASINNCRLCVTHLPADLNTEAFIRKICESTNGVGRVSIYRRPDGGVKNALVYYKTHIDAAMARRRLVPERSNFIDGANITIDWAHPNLSPRNVVEESGVVDEFGRLEIKQRSVELDRKNSWRDEHLKEKVRSYIDDKGIISPNKSDLSKQITNKKKTNSRKKTPRFNRIISTIDQDGYGSQSSEKIKQFDDFKTRDINGNLQICRSPSESSKASDNMYYPLAETPSMPPPVNFKSENQENIFYYQNQSAPPPLQYPFVNNFTKSTPIIFGTAGDFPNDDRRIDGSADNLALEFRKILESCRGLFAERALINEPFHQNMLYSSAPQLSTQYDPPRDIMKKQTNCNQVDWSLNQDNYTQNFIGEKPMNLAMQNQPIRVCPCGQNIPIVHQVEQNSGDVNQIMKDFSNNLRQGIYNYENRNTVMAFYGNQGFKQPRPILNRSVVYPQQP